MYFNATARATLGATSTGSAGRVKQKVRMCAGTGPENMDDLTPFLYPNCGGDIWDSSWSSQNLSCFHGPLLLLSVQVSP